MDYSIIFKARRRLVTEIKRATRPLLRDSGTGMQFLFARPITLVNMLQAWNGDDTESVFKIAGYADDGVIIYGELHGAPITDRIKFERIPAEDLARLLRLARRRIERGLDRHFVLPEIKLAEVDPAAAIGQTSVHIYEDGGFQHTITMGLLKGVGFFWFKREDVRLCGRHAGPFQPLQPATQLDVRARCPWCKGGELAQYWTVYKTTHERLALMAHLNRLLPAWEGAGHGREEAQASAGQ